MQKNLITVLFLWMSIAGSAKCLYVSPDGNDSHEGSKEHPFATLVKAQQVVQPGDTIYIRGGVYTPTVDESMGVKDKIYTCTFILDKSGESEDKRICYFAYPGERVVFDMSSFAPKGQRVSVFYVNGSWLHIRGIEIINTQVTISEGNTQSECFSNRGGSHNIYERLSMHDGMGIGFYLVKGSDNLVLNCDAYNNIETVSGIGGNVDGFGCHPASGGTGNVLKGCRAWWNSDDGFDLINAQEAVTIDSCWAFYNGYQPGTFRSAADGNGIKAGGYGMSNSPKVPTKIPMHIVSNSLAYYNKAGGLYSNHHLGGILWANNTASHNRWNYRMVNRKSVAEAVDVDGYGHLLVNNLSHDPREAHLTNLDFQESFSYNNTFNENAAVPANEDFDSMNAEMLTAPRNADGTLPTIAFLRPSESTSFAKNGMGYTYPSPGYEEIIGMPETIANQWLMVATIVVKDKKAYMEGPRSDEFTKFYVNDVNVKLSNSSVDLTPYSGTVTLKATGNGMTAIKVVNLDENGSGE